MEETKYQLIKVPIASAGESVKFSGDMDKMYDRITGLFVSLPEDKAIAGSELELKIADREIFPEGFEVKMLTTSLGVSPNNRFYDSIDEEAQGNRIEGKLKDGSKADKYPYVAKIYLRLQREAK